jgi:hypothetical protein
MTHNNNAARNKFSYVVAPLMYTLSCLTLQPPRTASSYPVIGGRQCSISTQDVRTHARAQQSLPTDRSSPRAAVAGPERPAAEPRRATAPTATHCTCPAPGSAAPHPVSWMKPLIRVCRPGALTSRSTHVQYDTSVFACQHSLSSALPCIGANLIYFSGHEDGDIVCHDGTVLSVYAVLQTLKPDIAYRQPGLFEHLHRTMSLDALFVMCCNSTVSIQQHAIY